MAVEASRPTIFSPEILMNKGNLMDSNGNMHTYGTGSGSVRYRILPGGGDSRTTKEALNPISVSGFDDFNGLVRYRILPGGGDSRTTKEALNPISVSGFDDLILLKDGVKSESGLTYVGKKRSRDDDINNYYPLLSSSVNHTECFQKKENSLFQNQQLEQLEIDCLISQHMQMQKMEMEDKRQNYSRRILTAVEQSISKKLISKEEEIDKINKLNCFLDERIQSLSVENHIWRELAQSNEATANALRSNLEQALALTQVQDDQHQQIGATIIDDEESCCDSNYLNRGGNGGSGADPSAGEISNRSCLNCVKKEASCLFLPCRHLCLCNACGHVTERCPFCNSVKNGCIQVVL